MTSPVRPRTALDRIGGPFALSWPVVAVAYGFTWMVFVLFLPAPAMPEELARIVFLTMAQALMVAVLRIAHGTFLRAATSRPRPWLTLTVFVVAAIVFTATMGVLMARQVVHPPAENTFGYVDTVAAIVVVLVVAAVAADAVGQYRRQQDELAASAERLEHVRSVVGEAIVQRRQEAIDTVTDQVAEAAQRVTADSPREAVETLRWAAQDLVRPLCHDLATRNVPFTATDPWPGRRGFNWVSMLDDATTGRPIRTVALVAGTTALTIVYRISGYGLVAGLRDTVANALAIGLGAVLANRMLEAIGGRCVLGVRVLVLTVVLGLLGALGVGAQRLMHEYGNLGTMLANVVITIFVGWTVAMLRAVQLQFDRADVAIERLQQDLEWEIARANQTQWQQQRALAREMHGPLQSAVNAAALRIDAAAREGTVSSALIEAERCSILKTLDLLPTAGQDRVPDLDLDFRRITGTWAGLCDIDIVVSAAMLAQLAADAACSSAVTDIVTESCANAIRHGHAKRVRVEIEPSSDERTISVVIDNDGDPLVPGSQSGLGTSLIDDVALEWWLKPTDEGTRMFVSLPIDLG